jgi:hypothetical protein
MIDSDEERKSKWIKECILKCFIQKFHVLFKKALIMKLKWNKNEIKMK